MVSLNFYRCVFLITFVDFTKAKVCATISCMYIIMIGTWNANNAINIVLNIFYKKPQADDHDDEIKMLTRPKIPNLEFKERQPVSEYFYHSSRRLKNEKLCFHIA